MSDHRPHCARVRDLGARCDCGADYDSLNALELRRIDCARAGHPYDTLEYKSGALRCGGCGAYYRPDETEATP